jgi:DNA-binding CsgD family transcriptional regulator
LYASQWDAAAPREREYLRALAELTASAPPGSEVTGADVARRLGEGTREVSYLRDRLLKKGTLFTRGRALQFVTPGMGEWVLRQVR